MSDEPSSDTQPTDLAAVDAVAVETYLRGLQARICDALESLEAPHGGARFLHDVWSKPPDSPLLGSGETRVLENGAVFERAGVAFSDVRGSRLPQSATQNRPELAGRGFRAMGVSLVFHPRNPFVPTVHMNVRFFLAEKADEAPARSAEAEAAAAGAEGSSPDSAVVARPSAAPAPTSLREGTVSRPIWWFGGGFDLTPYYGFEDDVRHWHATAHAACAGFVTANGAPAHPHLKKWCDDYFFIKHRNEPRGVGGLFFDDWSVGGFTRSFALMQGVGNHLLAAYLPIVERRRDTPYGARERDWQLYRRGRYVEFNLVWDRGTHFGLQSGGRTESILMSMPPQVAWRYDHQPEPGSAEARLYEHFLRPQDWLAQT